MLKGGGFAAKWEDIITLRGMGVGGSFYPLPLNEPKNRDNFLKFRQNRDGSVKISEIAVKFQFVIYFNSAKSYLVEVTHKIHCDFTN